MREELDITASSGLWRHCCKRYPCYPCHSRCTCMSPLFTSHVHHVSPPVQSEPGASLLARVRDRLSTAWNKMLMGSDYADWVQFKNARAKATKVGLPMVPCACHSVAIPQCCMCVPMKTCHLDPHHAFSFLPRALACQAKLWHVHRQHQQH